MQAPTNPAPTSVSVRERPLYRAARWFLAIVAVAAFVLVGGIALQVKGWSHSMTPERESWQWLFTLLAAEALVALGTALAALTLKSQHWALLLLASTRLGLYMATVSGNWGGWWGVISYEPIYDLVLVIAIVQCLALGAAWFSLFVAEDEPLAPDNPS